MRILMLTDFYPPIIGGLELHVRNLSIELVRRGHQVTVITLWHEGLAEEEHDTGVLIYRIRGTIQRVKGLFSNTGRRFSPPLPDPEAVLAIQRIVTDIQPDVVHAHNWLMYSYLPLKHWSRAPLVMTLHDYSMACPKKTLMRDEQICDGPGMRRCLSCSSQHYGAARGIPTVLSSAVMGVLGRSAVDMFLAVSSAVAEGNGLLNCQIPYRVIPNFVSDDVADIQYNSASELRQLPSDDYLLFIGVLSRHKGLDVLLRAYDGIPSAPPLVLIGPSSVDTPTSFPSGVYMCGEWPHQAVMQARHRSIAALVPSVWPDPCPTVVMEAMALGKPVIASNIGGLPDLVDDGVTGLLVPPSDVTALRAAIVSMINEPALRVQMGLAGIRRVISFKASTVVPQIEQVYIDLFDMRRSTQNSSTISHV